MRGSMLIDIIRKTCCLFFIFFPIFVSICTAQDTHYSTNQYGARSALMGGAVIGNVKDNTAVIYNPGGLGFIDSSTISINGNAYQIEKIRIYNALGNQKDFKNSQLNAIPLFLGGMFTKGKTKIKIGYSITSAVNFNFKSTARIDSYLPIVDDSESPGLEEFIGQASINSKLTELVYALGAGCRLNEKWSVGITNMMMLRSLDYGKSSYARFFLNQPDYPLVSSTFSKNADYFHARYAAKLGINYRSKKLSAGVTYTTPSIKLLGEGSIAADVIGTNIYYKGSRTDLLVNDRQEKLSATYKSPFAITAGINLNIKRSSVGLTVQYYGSVGIYDVLKANPSAFFRPASIYGDLGSEQFLRLKEAAKSVFNIGVGYEYWINPDLILTASFRTDQSYFDDRLNEITAIKSDITAWDIYHFTFGGTFTRGKSKLSLGVLYNTGANAYTEQTGSYKTVQESNFLQGTNVITKARYQSIGFLLGYTLMFKQN